MTGAGAYKIWEKTVAALAPFRAQAGMGLPQGYERFSAALDVLMALRKVLIAGVTGNEDGRLGVIASEWAALHRELHEAQMAMLWDERTRHVVGEPSAPESLLERENCGQECPRSGGDL